MSLQTLERNILAWVRDVLHNRKLRMKDLLEWSTGPVKPREGEIEIRIEYYGVNVCVLKEHDKRKPEDAAQERKEGDGG